METLILLVQALLAKLLLSHRMFMVVMCDILTGTVHPVSILITSSLLLSSIKTSTGGGGGDTSISLCFETVFHSFDKD